MRRVVFNQKGGVGKSTITCNLAAISAKRGHRTLVIDLDPQGNSTHYLMGETEVKESDSLAGFYEELLAVWGIRKGPTGYIVETPFPDLDLMASHPALTELKGKLETRYKMFKLRDALRTLSDYDAIYIDTPPALNFYTRSALIAANSCLIPFDCDDFSRRALYALLESVREIQEDHNEDLQVEGIVVNQYQARAKLPQRLAAELKEEGLPLLDAYLSSSVKIRESHDRALPLVHLDPRHKLTQEFTSLFESLNGSN